MRSHLLGGLACACALLFGAVAQADPPSSDTPAHQAYERGTTAYRKKDYATAAREYAAADALSPNPVALQAAIDATVQADDPVLGEQLLDRARGEPRTSALLATMLVAEQKFAHRTGRIAVTCAAQPCLATVDGAAIDPSEPVVVRIGAHTVLIDAGGSATTRTVTVRPDEVVTATSTTPPGSLGSPPAAPASTTAATSASPAAPSPAPPSARYATQNQDRDSSSGLAPIWFLVGVGATVLTGGATVVSGIDTANQSSTFQPCRTKAVSGCSQLASNGQFAQTRTNVLLGVTAAFGVTTLVLIPLTRWQGATVGITSGGIAFDARF
jgi:hypothetical protein